MLSSEKKIALFESPTGTVNKFILNDIIGKISKFSLFNINLADWEECR